MNKRDVHGDNLRIPGGSLSVQKGVSEYPPGLYIVPFGRFEVSLYTFTQANFFFEDTGYVDNYKGAHNIWGRLKKGAGQFKLK